MVFRNAPLIKSLVTHTVAYDLENALFRHDRCSNEDKEIKNMEQITRIIADASYFQLAAMLAAALFFFMVAFRELSDDNFYGYFFAAVGIFFLAIHALFLMNIPSAVSPLNNLSLWSWLIAFLAPSLIVLYLLFGFFNVLMAKIRVGLVKIFFGLTLFCYLFMLGGGWPIDVRGILVLIWSGLWFGVELNTAS
jgi:hypothetical protein